MDMKKILICGDSFAADWTVKYPGEGWPNLLAKKYDVLNLAQAGCSEYKIYLQLTSVELSDFDKVIISHTSPNRIYTTHHPVHRTDPLHKNSDLIYSDIKEHSKSFKELVPLTEFFEQYFDLEYAKFTHGLICEKIDKLVGNNDVIHLTNIDWSGYYQFEKMFQFSNLFETNRGLLNHYDDIGNHAVAERIVSWIES